VSQSRTAAHERDRQFGKPEEEERPSLEAVTRTLVTTQGDTTKVRALVNCKVCRTLTA
jgi:hypothetical protein